MKKAWNIITNAVLIFILLVGIMALVSLLPFKGNYKILAVMSGSMEPTLPMGGVVVVKPADQYNIDEIITFESQNSKQSQKYTTHRIVKMNQGGQQDYFYTKGDANETSDTNYIKKDQIIGKVILSVALVGYIIGYAKTLPGVVIIIVLATIIIYEEIKKIRSEVKIIKESKKVKESKKKKSIEGKKRKAKK